MVTADELLAAIGAFAGSSRRHGARSLVCTIPPFSGSDAWTVQAEAVRQEVNARLKAETSFDAVVDLDQPLTVETFAACLGTVCTGRGCWPSASLRHQPRRRIQDRRSVSLRVIRVMSAQVGWASE